jgi:hypothetical protein
MYNIVGTQSSNLKNYRNQLNQKSIEKANYFVKFYDPYDRLIRRKAVEAFLENK